MPEVRIDNDTLVVFKVLRTGILDNGTPEGIPVRVIAEPSLHNAYVVIVAEDGTIGWALPHNVV